MENEKCDSFSHEKNKIVFFLSSFYFNLFPRKVFLFWKREESKRYLI